MFIAAKINLANDVAAEESEMAAADARATNALTRKLVAVAATHDGGFLIRFRERVENRLPKNSQCWKCRKSRSIRPKFYAAYLTTIDWLYFVSALNNTAFGR
jgi:hypothetical protein